MVPPGTALGKAVHYARNHYTRVIRYLKYPEVTPDNNIAENAIRISGVPQGEARGTLAAPFVIGRKNWLFCSIPRWAYASAVMYSLTETAKANDLNPQRYPQQVFETLPLIAEGGYPVTRETAAMEYCSVTIPVNLIAWL